MSGYNRRFFLKTGAVLTTGVAAKRILAAAPSNNLHFALVGAGNQGRQDAGILLKVPGVKLTAICEINPKQVEEAQGLAPDARVYEDWSDLYTSEKDLQAVLIALPEHTHAPAAIAAMEAGLDVFCEKPLAYSLEQGRAMIAARDKHQRILQIGQQRRSNPLYYLAERLVQKEGVVGQIMRVDVFWDRWEDWKRPLPDVQKNFSPWGFPTLDHLINWRLYRQYGHGLMTENGTHQMDAASWLLGGRKPKYVCGMGATRYPDGRETHDICSAEYMYDGDVIVRFTQDFHQGFNYGWSYGELVLGDEATLRVTAEQQIVIYDRNRRSRTVPISQLGDIELAGVAATVNELTAAELDREGGGLRCYSYEHEMRIFAHCIATREQPTCTGEIALNSLAATVLGTEAQFSRQYKEFTPEMFA
jgi:predicted dehydrogenase